MPISVKYTNKQTNDDVVACDSDGEEGTDSDEEDGEYEKDGDCGI